MADQLPRTVHRELQFAHGRAIGISNRWEKGQYCSILSAAGIVGCGIYDLQTPAEFGQAIAIAKGTPAKPLVEPEDLLDARIVGLTPKAGSYGIRVGMTGREATELMLQAGKAAAQSQCSLHAPREDSSRSSVMTTLQSQAALSQTPRSSAEPGIRVKTIDHVTLVVKDLEQSRRFYVEALGMREVPRPAFSFAGSWFQAGTTQIHLILEFAGSGPAGNLVPEQLRSSRTHHFAFEVDDAAAAIPYLHQQQVAILSGPKLRPDGFVQVFVTDPDGHVVELCSPPKVV
jgi:catechol 2,3-dioxygenase-like lactoylglutathione lyase family enzyme/uncharacterized protein YunC (DUF1805 family)